MTWIWILLIGILIGLSVSKFNEIYRKLLTLKHLQLRISFEEPKDEDEINRKHLND